MSAPLKRLTGLDAAFLAMEAEASPMHTLKLLIFEPLPSAQPIFDSLERGVRERLHLLPMLRRRLLHVPFNLNRPLWVDDPHLLLSDHLHQRTVPAPGGPRERDALVAELASAPLNLSRPLWEMWVLNGLESGRTAVLAKIHHALADGMTAAEWLHRVMSTRPDEVSVSDPSEVSVSAVRPQPSSARSVVEALRDHGQAALGLPALLGESVTGLRALRALRRTSNDRSPLPLRDVPRSLINGELRPTRALATQILPLAPLLETKERLGVTLNDLTLALVASALRGYLVDRGALPPASLVASVPTATEAHAHHPSEGQNHVSSLFIPLATDEPDPHARLRAIHQATAHAKTAQKALGPDLLGAWLDYVPAPVLRATFRALSRPPLATQLPPALNLIVSTVRGPQAALFVPGYRLVELYSVGPLLAAMGLNVTAWSYQDALYVGILTSKNLLPDPSELADRIQAAVRELS